MTAQLHKEAFDDDNWIFEIKWDGYRAIAETGKKEVKLYSRNGISFHNIYPAVYDALAGIKEDMVLDGEIVALDEDGKPRFQLLQKYAEMENVQLAYYVFDILYYKGRSVKDLPLLERKELLKSTLPQNDIIHYCDHIAGEGKAFFKAMQKQGLEGMIAKRADSIYTENVRSSDWLKVKHTIIEEAIICGFTKGRNSRKFFGALILGAYKKNKLVYIGHTGTGFTDKSLKYVYDQLKPLIRDSSPFAEKIVVNAPVTWVEPKLVCNLKFTEVTGEGLRRHPVFLGLREDKGAKEVNAEPIIEQTETMAKTIKKSTTGSSFSNLDKIYWPGEGYTKGDLIDYYERMYKYIIPYIKDRPLSLLRNPDGISKPGFFQKDASAHTPVWVKTEKIWSGSNEKYIDYHICNDKKTLLYLANLGCIEMNPWFSRIGSIENPDYLVLDIDPSVKNTFDQVVETANVIHDILEKAGAKSYCKTSGATGLHVYVPLAAKYDYEQAKSFAQMIAILAQEQLPDFTSLERSLKKRGDKNIYIDYLQNRTGQTLACAYSLRPKPGAPVSTPLEWKEVKKGLDPLKFNIKTIQKRVEKVGDIFKPVLGRSIDMQKCLKKLGA